MRIFFSLLLVFFSVFESGCFQKKMMPCDVVVSIPPYIYFVNRLMGDDVAVVSLVPQGANPHLYEPSPKEIAMTRQAKVWVRLSEHFEKKVAAAWQEENPQLITINLAEKMDLPLLPHKKHSCHCCSHQKDQIDLHFWLSLRLAKQQAELIACALVKAFPEKSNIIEDNLTSFLQELDDLDIAFTQKLAPFAGQAILVSHPAFGYFCYDYRLREISLEQEGKDPLPKEISSLINSAHADSIRTVFTQPQYNNKGAEMIAKTLQLTPHEVDPYSANYIENISYIAQCVQVP